MFSYRKALFQDLKKGTRARKLVGPRGRFPPVAKMKITAPPGEQKRKATGGLTSRQEWWLSGAALRKDDASLHPEKVGAEQVLGWASWQRSRGSEGRQLHRPVSYYEQARDPGWLLQLLSLLLARFSEQVSTCYGCILFLSCKHNQIKLSKCIATACKRRMRLQTQVI